MNMKMKKWGVYAICFSFVLLGSACQRQDEVATAPPAERPAPATTEQQPPATAERQPPATAEQQPPATAERQPPATAETPARPADEFMGQAPAHGPETVVLTAKNGDVTLTHAKHAARVECSTCHGEGPPGAIELDRESGHKLCLGCHQEQGAGPVKCAECHVRR